MVDFAQSDEYVYTKKRLKQKLEEKYGDFLMFSEIDGKRNVVCFRQTAHYIINQRYYDERSSDPVEESLRVIKTAAKLIRSDIRDWDYNNLFYPSTEDLQSPECTKSWLPEYLSYFLDELFDDEIKQSSIGQCIVKAVRPRSVLPPLLFGIGVEMDHIF